jgi:UDP-glucose 4-epimerase
MRVVVVGASGNVGTSLVSRLAEDDQVQSIVGVARRRPSWSPAKTEWVAADIGSDELVPHFRGADAVVHLAWLFQPTRDPVTTWRENVLGGSRVFRAVGQAEVPVLVYASSVGAYSPAPASDKPVDESWPTDGWPTASYSREKAYLERTLDAFERAEPDRRVVRMRPGFIFKRESAVGQRRLFVGPFVPGALARPELVPVVPDIPGLRFQALHTEDAAEAYRLALLRPVRGAFNLAAEPVIRPAQLAELLRARPVQVPAALVRASLAAAWRLRLVPASPELFDLVMRLPLLDCERARIELGWRPVHTAMEALHELLIGLRSGEGMPTPPLSPRTSGRLRAHELGTGVGETP